MFLDFDKPVHIVDWVQNETLYIVPAFLGLLLMAASARWDTQHTTSAVRTLDGVRPVTFQQEPTERDMLLDELIERVAA